MASRMLLEGVLGGLSDAALLFTFTLAEGLVFVGELGLGAETLGLRDAVDPTFRTTGELGFEVLVVKADPLARAVVVDWVRARAVEGILVMALRTRGLVGVVGVAGVLGFAVVRDDGG